jgi:hypothetical protein
MKTYDVFSFVKERKMELAKYTENYVCKIGTYHNAAD